MNQMFKNILNVPTRMAIANEGWRSEMYKDTEGIETIGVGYNLRRRNARAELASVGADLDLLMAGRSLTVGQILLLLDMTMGEATDTAKKIFPKLDTYSHARQHALIDMAFNLGERRLRGFRKMIAAIHREDWSTAADEAKDSKWYGQVKGRAVRNVASLRKG